MRRVHVLAAVAFVAVVGLAGCGGKSSPGSGNSPATAESNPSGDIPDNQAYVTYTSTPGRFQLKVPEGWARADATDTVTFTDRLNGIQVTWKAASTPPSVQRANAQDVPDLQRGQPGFALKKVSPVTLPGGSAVLIESQEDSPPNSVTGKRYRLDVVRYVLLHNGQQAVLALSSPSGSDNVDPWKLVSESFRWQ